jgi:hypothetical protein
MCPLLTLRAQNWDYHISPTGIRMRSGAYASSHQDTDRTARTVFNVAVCRVFLRSIQSIVYRPQETVTDHHDRYRPLIDCLEMSRFAGLSPPR